MHKQEPEVRSYRVLVVEDEGLIAHDIAKRLESLGHTVVGTAATADEAIAAAADAELVLMDIRIDGARDGIAAATEIREKYRLPVIFLTAHADRSTLERAKAAAPYGYMIKPLGPATLQASIEMAIYKHAMERELEEREAWLRTTVASAGAAIIAADKQGSVLLMNAAAEALLGVDFASARAKPLSETLKLADSVTGEEVRELDALALVRDAPTPLDPHIEAIARSGQRRAVAGTISPVRTPTGTAGVVVSLYDVGAARWQELRVRQAQRIEATGRLAAAVAADCASLVAVIRKQVGPLLAQFGEYPPARRAVDEIHQAAVAADQLTKRLETLGSRPPARPELLSLNGTLRRLTRLMESLAAGKLKLAIQPCPGIGRILADAAQLEQALMTLVMHACAVSTSGGTLRIETSVVETLPREKQVSLTLTYPYAEEDLERMFDPARQGGDDGLGLALVQSMVGEQGGLIYAQPAGGGTCIHLLLPLVEESLATAGPASATAPSILLVESRERVRAHLHNVAEAAGYNLLEASSWEEAATLCDMQDRVIDVLVASPEDATGILNELTAARHPRSLLRVVPRAAEGDGEIEAPFTEQALLDRLQALAPRARTATSS